MAGFLLFLKSIYILYSQRAVVIQVNHIVTATMATEDIT